MGNRSGIAHALQGLGLATLEVGDGPTARALLTECLLRQREIDDVVWLAPTLEGLAGAGARLVREGRGAPAAGARALRLAGAASALREAIDQRPSAAERVRLKRWLRPARRALPAAAAEAAWRAGLAMSFDQAIDYALGGEVES